MSGTRQADRIDSLQIGRGVAALLVVLHHATSLVKLNDGGSFAENYFHAGSAGVDFFFVLSGFIIFHRHAREFGQPDKLAEYGWRRLARVFPIYWIVTLAILPLYFLIPAYGIPNGTDPKVIASSLLLLPMNPGPILFVGWTLTHELWFYLLFAGLIAKRGIVFKVIVALWIAAMAVLAVTSGDDHLLENPWFRVAFSPLNLEFALGCFAAWLIGRSAAKKAPAYLWNILLTTGCGLFAFLLFNPSVLSAEVVEQRVLGFGLSSLLIVLGSAGRKLAALQKQSESLFRGFIVFLGDASYSLYLLHTPVLSAVWKAGEITGMVPRLGASAVAWLAVIASILTASVFHLWIERPLLRRLRFPRRSPLAAAASNGAAL